MGEARRIGLVGGMVLVVVLAVLVGRLLVPLEEGRDYVEANGRWCLPVVGVCI